MFRIGEFSRLAQLSVRVLRHYDEIGLLTPAFTEPASGYRYYLPEQLVTVQRIIALKELGLRLEQVHRLVHENVSVDEMTGMLRLESARAEQARAEADARLRRIGARLAELSTDGGLSDVDIVEKSVAAMPFLAIRAVVADIAEAEALIDRVQATARARLSIPGSLIVVAHDDFLDTDNLDLEIGYARGDPPSLDLNDGRRLTMGTLAGVARMLSTVCVATQEDGHRRAHHAIGAWLSRHGCRLDGPGREILHPHAGDDRLATIEIQYPITEASVRARR